ncbi:MAG: polyprenyl synthetase family protein [Chloroflexota bacterium]
MLAQFYRMMNYTFGYTDEELVPSAYSSGKRFRPLLCLLACDGASGSWRDALNTAVAIELIHNFSLIHDDIEDRDEARRHRPTVWKLWGEPHAINVGDAVFALAATTVLSAHGDHATCLDIAHAFQKTALTLTEGQYLDMTFEEYTDVSPGMYVDMVCRKTSALIAFSLWSGGRVAGANQKTLQALQECGMEMGQAFQIHDDIMGIWGSSDVTGKEPAQDLRNRKKTLPVLLAFQGAGPAAQELLRRFYSHESDDISSVLEIFSSTNAKEVARASCAEHVAIALDALTYADLIPKHSEELKALCREVAGQ